MTRGSILSPTARLVALADTGAAVLASEDVRGSDVRDPAAELIGTVDDLVMDAETGRVMLLRVGRGGMFGIGRSHRLIPVDVVTDVVKGAVFLDCSRERVDEAPSDRGWLADERYISEVYAFFGQQPFWSEGYQQPDWTNSL